MTSYQLTDMQTVCVEAQSLHWGEGYESTFIFISAEGQPRTVRHAQMKVMRHIDSQEVAAGLRELADKIEQIGVSDEY